MATPDFSKIFSTNSPSTPFTWSDSDYLEGWHSIAMTPPSRQQFDALQMISDEKAKYLYDYKAPKHSPVFTGDPVAPTPAWNDNDTSIATTAFVKHWIDEVGQGITDIGKWYYCWADDLIFQYAECVTDSDGIGVATFPIDFPAFGDGRGCYIPFLIALRSYVEDSPFTVTFGMGATPQYQQPGELTFMARNGETGQPAANMEIGVGAFGMQPNP